MRPAMAIRRPHCLSVLRGDFRLLSGQCRPSRRTAGDRISARPSAPMLLSTGASRGQLRLRGVGTADELIGMPGDEAGRLTRRWRASPALPSPAGSVRFVAQSSSPAGCERAACEHRERARKNQRGAPGCPRNDWRGVRVQSAISPGAGAGPGLVSDRWRVDRFG